MLMQSENIGKFPVRFTAFYLHVVYETCSKSTSIEQTNWKRSFNTLVKKDQGQHSQAKTHEAHVFRRRVSSP